MTLNKTNSSANFDAEKQGFWDLLGGPDKFRFQMTCGALRGIFPLFYDGFHHF